MAYGGFKDLSRRRTASDKVLRDKTFSYAKNLKYDGHQKGFASMVYKFFDQKSASLADKSAKGSGAAMLQNEQLAEELHKTIIKKFKKEKFILHLKTIFWG